VAPARVGRWSNFLAVISLRPFLAPYKLRILLLPLLLSTLLERRVHKHKGSELCCKIFEIFQRTGLGPVRKGCSWTSQKRKFSKKWGKEIKDTGFLCGNTSSPTEVWKPWPTSCRIFKLFTIRAKTRYKVTHFVTTCNPYNRLPKIDYPTSKIPWLRTRPKVHLT